MNECVGRVRVVSETTMMEFTWTRICGLCVGVVSVCGVVCPSVYLKRLPGCGTSVCDSEDLPPEWLHS